MRKVEQMKMLLVLFSAVLLAGCTSQPPAQETKVLDVETIVDYYPLGSYTEKAGEGFYVIAGDVIEVKKGISEIVVQKVSAKTNFVEGDNLNLVVFRGVFSTGGYEIKIDKVERTGNTFVIHATYTDPDAGMMVTQAFTQPAAIIPIGRLPKGNYGAELKVTKILEGEVGKRTAEEGREHAGIAFAVK